MLSSCLVFPLCPLMINSVDQNILKHMIDSQAEFLMEVTDKTKADVKVMNNAILQLMGL